MKYHLYILKRLIAIIPTLLGISLITFLLINLAPGSPIDQALDAMKFGSGGDTRAAVGGGASSQNQLGVSDEVVNALKAQYGFDKPLPVRYWLWLKNMVSLDFGRSFLYNRPVMEVISARFPISLQFGLVSFFLTYTVSIGLGLLMARKEGGVFDQFAGFLLLAATAIPPFAFAIAALVFFTGGTFFNWFPLGYLTSENYEALGGWDQFKDRVHHFVLPLMCYMIGGFAGLAFLSRNALLEELGKDYVRTARGIGVSETRVFLKHALRNALIPIATGIGGFVGVFLSGSLLIETIFQLDGIGLLGFRALVARDYNLIMGLAFLQSLALLLGNLLGDVIYMLVDPRIDFTEVNA